MNWNKLKNVSFIVYNERITLVKYENVLKTILIGYRYKL